MADFTITEDHYDILCEVDGGSGSFQADRNMVDLLYWGYLEPVSYGDGDGVGITQLGTDAIAAWENEQE